MTIPPTTPNTDLATDRWCTPDDELERVDQMLPEGIGLDPFHDPMSRVEAVCRIDARNGGDAFFDAWDTPDDKLSAFVNSPYSGDNPAKCARRIVVVRRARPELTVLNLCIAAPGSGYWRAWVWPRVRAVAYLGRLPFRTAVDLFKIDKETGKPTDVVVARAGELVKGNRNEIAQCLYTNDDEQVEAFREIYRAFPVTVVR